MKIVTTSPEYLRATKGLNDAIIANGGRGLGLSLERSPNAERDGAMGNSEMYEVNLFESYEDRNVAITHYTFDPVKKRLSVYDAGFDGMLVVDFDKSLLSDFERVCN